MSWRGLFATKSLERLHAEAQGENRLRRVLGPVGLTSLGVGAIIGAGIFVMTGRVAANDAGPGILVSFAVAGVACALAAFCYAEFASMAPVAGSAYTYAYATLGELFAWIIGWDLILEYAMSAATVAASWSKYLNKFLEVVAGEQWKVPEYLCHDPFSEPGAWFNLPAVLILALCTTILVIGIRESATSNTALVIVKLGVVIFVIVVGIGYVNTSNWFDIPVEARKQSQLIAIPKAAGEHAKNEQRILTAANDWIAQFPPTEAPNGDGKAPQVKSVSVASVNDETRTLAVDPALATEQAPVEARGKAIREQALALYFKLKADEHPDDAYLQDVRKGHEKNLPKNARDEEIARAVLAKAKIEGVKLARQNWGLLGEFGFDQALGKFDDSVRSNFMPYGFSGIMVGAALVFFAFIGFDSISTHSEEAIKPQRDVPFGIIASLIICTLLYIAVAGIITGMVRYPEIDTNAAVASAFTEIPALKYAGALIAAGALAGMTSVLLITFLSQARVFLAMARDGLLPHGVFGAVHEHFRTPHISTMFTGGLMCVVAAFTPIATLEEMVNIGTLFAFVIVCAAVLILRIRRPEAPRPFRCPAVFVVAPLGILVNLTLMFFLPTDTWWRLLIWLCLGLVIYFCYGFRHSLLHQGPNDVPVPVK